MKKVIRALNEIGPNVMGFVLVLVGSALCLRGMANVGSNLVTGGFALITGAHLQASAGK